MPEPDRPTIARTSQEQVIEDLFADFEPTPQPGQEQSPVTARGKAAVTPPVGSVPVRRETTEVVRAADKSTPPRESTESIRRREGTESFRRREGTDTLRRQMARAGGHNPRFFTLLVERGLIPPEEAPVLEKDHHGNALLALEELIDYEIADRSILATCFADAAHMPYVDLARVTPDPALVRLLAADIARRHRCIPLCTVATGVAVACADPCNPLSLQEISRKIGKPVLPAFSLPNDISDAIDAEYAGAELLARAGSGVGAITHNGTLDLERLNSVAGTQSAVELAEHLLLLAMKERASDIHLEPLGTSMRVRLRIDGVLHERFRLDARLTDALVSRLKILAGCDIIEKRRPQDGRISLTLAERSVDFRFSCVPGLHGEKIVMRVLGTTQKRAIPSLDELGMSVSNLAVLKRILSIPNGVFFVTGPTGSGKTTTLYSVLKHLNSPDINILTIEDPVEYKLPGAHQVQVNQDIDLTFATALRAFLRQDPNIILVGEVRDMETAKIASQAALTGHLVLSTMHTNSALQAVTRLVEIGVEPFLVAPAIIGVMAQRLVRRLCPHCREPVALAPEIANRYFNNVNGRSLTVYRGKGCEACHRSGYAGRIAIHEIFLLTEDVRRMIARNASILDIDRLAYERGFKPLLHDGLKKVLRGLTTLAEIERVTAYSE